MSERILARFAEKAQLKTELIRHFSAKHTYWISIHQTKGTIQR